MLSIGAFSKISNVTTKTLRYYDEIGLLRPTHVDSASGYRYYDVSQLRRILLITKLKSYGFSLEEIIQVLNGPDDRLLLSIIKDKEAKTKERLCQYAFILKQIREDIRHLERGIDLMSYFDQIEIKLVETTPQNLLSIRQKINVEDFGKYLGKVYETIHREKLTVAGAPMAIYHDEEFNPENYDTEIAVPVEEVVTGTRDFPGCLCAMATLKGPYSQLSSIYSKLKQWTEDEGYQINNSPFEVYVTDPASCPPEEYVTEVYFPVKKI